MSQLDATGKEQLRVSRLAMDVVGSQTDFSKDPKFTEAVANKVYYGPVYFRRESEPYMTLSLAGTRRDAGVSVAEVNLKLIWDVVSQIKVGEHGQAYVIDAQGRLIAHPDISLVLRNTDLTRLAQVEAARAARAGGRPSRCRRPRTFARAQGADRLRAGRAARLDRVRRTAESRRPMRRSTPSIERSGLLLLAGLAARLRRRPVPGAPDGGADPGAARRAPRASARAISASASRSRPATSSKGWPTSSTTWPGKLQESYADLEKKVEDRTRELTESLAAADRDREVLKVISRSPVELQTGVRHACWRMRRGSATPSIGV